MALNKNNVHPDFNERYKRVIDQAFSRNPNHWPVFSDADLFEVIQGRKNRKTLHQTLWNTPKWKSLTKQLRDLDPHTKSGTSHWRQGNKLLKQSAIYSKNWENASSVENVIGMPSDPAVYGSMVGLLANANLVHAEYAGMTVDLEQAVIKQMAELAGYDYKKATGIFTQGGTLCNLYGYLLGIRKSMPEARQFGMGGYVHDYRIINSQGGHYSNTINLSLLGVNIREKTIRIRLMDNNAMDTKDFALQLESCFRLKCVVPTIMLTMGTTDTFGVDRVKPIYDIRNKLCKKYGVTVKPHIHVDSAVGWTMLFFLKYNFSKNPLKINPATLEGLKQHKKLFRELKYADSYTIDFQKWGFVPYTSSLVMIKNAEDMKSMENDPENFSYFDKETQGHTHLQSTIECSRGAVGAYGAFAGLHFLGVQGYQLLIAHSLQNANYFRSLLFKMKHVKVLSHENQGPSVGFRVYDKKVVQSAKAEYHYEYIKRSTMEYEKRVKGNTLFHHTLYKKRKKVGLFTNWVESIAHTSYDDKGVFVGIPGEKAVFMNPQTTRKEIDLFVANIFG